jgi:hypothetical protein
MPEERAESRLVVVGASAGSCCRWLNSASGVELGEDGSDLNRKNRRKDNNAQILQHYV